MSDSETRTTDQISGWAWPVGSAMITGQETNPVIWLGVGEWELLDKLKVGKATTYVWLRTN